MSRLVMSRGLYLTADVMLSFFRKICEIRFFRRVKHAYMHLLAIGSNCSPPAVMGFRNAKEPGLVIGKWLPKIFQVNRVTDITDVSNSVVRLNSIDVINVADRPALMNIKKRKPMYIGTSFVYFHLSVLFLWDGNRIPRILSPISYFVRKYPSFWVIGKNFTYTRNAKIRVSHEAVLSQIGQRPVNVRSVNRLRYFKPFKALAAHLNNVFLNECADGKAALIKAVR